MPFSTAVRGIPLLEPLNHVVSASLYLNIAVLLDNPRNSPCFLQQTVAVVSIADHYLVPIITRGLST